MNGLDRTEARYRAGKHARSYIDGGILLFLVASLIFLVWAIAASDGPAYTEDLVATLKSDEGFRAQPYRDTQGVLTFGYGYNIEAGIIEPDADYLLRAHIVRSAVAIGGCWPPFNDQPVETRSALLDLAYQVGDRGLCGFTDTLEALERGDCAAARAGILHSAEAQETPNRAQRVATALCQP